LKHQIITKQEGEKDLKHQTLDNYKTREYEGFKVVTFTEQKHEKNLKH
jgi:hypothetical protein